VETFNYDPLRSDSRANPYPYYAAMRKEAPVYRVEPYGFYLVSRYADVLFVLKNPALFSSGAMRLMMLSGFGERTEGSAFPQPDPARLAALAKVLPFSPAEFLQSRSLIVEDPPVHGPLRSLVNRGFAPRRIADLEPRIRQITRRLLDRIREKDSFDLVTDFAVPLPVTVIAEMLGVEPERQQDFKRWSNDLLLSTSGTTSSGQADAILRTFKELNEYFLEVVAARRKQPRDDLISTLVQAEAGEVALSTLEVINFSVLLLIAGNETTTHLLGNTLIALLGHPQELAKLVRDPQLVPSLVEEALRFDSPVQMLVRQTTQEVELAGTRLPKGSLVMPIFASANRDDMQFPDPDRFDVARNPQGHLAFGFGIHFCLGAALARLETRVAFEEMLPALLRLERTESAVEYVDSFLLRGARRLPLRFRH